MVAIDVGGTYGKRGHIRDTGQTSGAGDVDERLTLFVEEQVVLKRGYVRTGGHADGVRPNNIEIQPAVAIHICPARRD